MSPQKRLWAPWRMSYIAKTRKAPPKKCIFCHKETKSSNSKDHVLTRGRFGFSLLNRYPYNNGHLLIAPYRHIGNLEALTPEEWSDILFLMKDAVSRLNQVLFPQGYNIGINLGRVAGAGIPGHLHLHIVPRWEGDVNFMPVCAQTKVISQSLQAVHQLLSKTLPSHGKKRQR